MKVTIRNIDPKLWEQAKHDCITEKKSLGAIVNEGLQLRQAIKKENKAHVVGRGKP